MPREFPKLGVTAREIDATRLKQRLDSGDELTLIDTRRPADFETWKIDHPNLSVVNIPFMEFLDESGEKPATEVPDGIPEGELVTCCAKGISSTYVAEFLEREGYDILALTDGMEGWATLYEDHPVETSTEETTVLQLHRPSSGCLSYLLISGDEAAVIDPLRAFANEYERYAQAHGATLIYAIDTHVHADHVSGLREVAETTGATVVLPAGATDRGLVFEATLLEDGDTLALGEDSITARALPGHTTETLGYRFGGVFVTGDTLFLDGVARPDLEDADAAKAAAATLWETLQEIQKVPAETTIAPAHVGPTTAPGADGSFTASLGELMERLAAFEETQEAFVERVTTGLPPRPTNFAEIIAINLGQRSATVEEAFELELGPNNCAVGE